MTPPRLGIDTFWIISSSVKPPAHRAGLPGHAVGSRMRANEISFFIGPLDPLCPRPIGPLDSAYKAGLAGYLPVKRDMAS